MAAGRQRWPPPRRRRRMARYSPRWGRSPPSGSRMCGGGGPRPPVLGRATFDIDPLPSAFFASSEGICSSFDLGANGMNIGLLNQAVIIYMVIVNSFLC
jgi:hypothetical protein